MTADDPFRDGYRAADRHHKNRAAIVDRTINAWSDPDKADVQALVRKHWPKLATALDDLRSADA